MQIPNYVRPWLDVRRTVLLIILFFILLSAIVQFAAFALSQNFVISSFGVQPEDITLALQLSYIGILAMLPIHFRLIRYFEFRNYLIVSISAGILLNILCLNNTDIFFFFILRFLQGLVVCAIAGSMLVMISTFLKMEYKKIVAPSIFYGTILSSSVLIGLVFATVVIDNDWKEIYYYLIAFQSASLLLVAITFSPRSGLKRYPLYQIDWAGTVFFGFAAVAMAYTWIYGPKYYWFDDSRIIFSALLFLCCTALFLFRSAQLKRPLISLDAFRHGKFWVALSLLALYFGIKESLNLVVGYAANILHWSPAQVSELGLYNVAGLIVFMAISAKLILNKKLPIPGFFLSGFSVMLLYHLWLYYHFTPDLSYNDLILPMFLQGAASGLLFVPIMIFVITSVPASTGITGLVVAAYVRFITLLNVSAGFYNLQLYYNQHFKEGFLRHTSNVDQTLSERMGNYRQVFLSKGISPDQAEKLAQLNIAKVLGLQAQLLSNRAIFLCFSWVLFSVIILILILLLVNTIKKNYYSRQ